MALNILVCSDNPQVVEPLTSIARREGYRFMVCGQGGEALRALMVFKFDLLILDLEILGLDSLFLLSAVKRIDPQLFVVAISRRPVVHTREIQQKAALYHLVQPPSSGKMEQVVKVGVEHVNRQRSQEGLGRTIQLIGEERVLR